MSFLSGTFEKMKHGYIYKCESLKSAINKRSRDKGTTEKLVKRELNFQFLILFEYQAK